jgi:hypothetical protein
MRLPSFLWGIADAWDPAPKPGSLGHIQQARDMIAEIEIPEETKPLPVQPPPSEPVKPRKGSPAETAAAALAVMLGAPGWDAMTETQRAGYRDMATRVLSASARARRERNGKQVDERPAGQPDAGEVPETS